MKKLKESTLHILRARLEKDGLLLGVCCGSGGFGHVFKVYEQKTGLLYGVVKVAEFSDDNNVEGAEDVVIDNKHAMMKELDVLSHHAREPYIVSLKKEMQEFQARGTQYGYFIMEPLISLAEAWNTIVADWVESYGAVIVLAYLGYAICAALQALHSKNRAFSHRDVKLDNIFILLSPDLCLSRSSFKLGDFGICNCSEAVASHTVNVRNRLDKFRSPDLLPTIESDVFCLGAVLAYAADIPFNTEPGFCSAADYGELGSIIERMLASEKKDRPTPKACMDEFDRIISRYESKISNDKNNCAASIRKLNEGKTNALVMPQDTTKAMRYCGIRDWLRGDLKSARANFAAAGDLFSRYYLASMDAQEGYTKSALQRARQLCGELNECRNHPVFDYVVALLYSLGDPLQNKLERTTADAVLLRADREITVM